jgi:hypothetical protein
MGFTARWTPSARLAELSPVKTPAILPRFRSALVASADGSPGRYKVRLPHGHTVYEVRIDGEGNVVQVDGRKVHGNADLGFRIEDALGVETY